VALFMTGFIPLAHKMFTDGLQGLDGFLTSHIVASTMFYMGGTIFYMTHIPEKCLPGVFDIYVSTTTCLKGNAEADIDGRELAIKYFIFALWRANLPSFSDCKWKRLGMSGELL
jgi:predicted membrane channel-forming protein YqfA (hemolysin III family)